MITRNEMNMIHELTEGVVVAIVADQNELKLYHYIEIFDTEQYVIRSYNVDTRQCKRIYTTFDQHVAYQKFKKQI